MTSPIIYYPPVCSCENGTPSNVCVPYTAVISISKYIPYLFLGMAHVMRVLLARCPDRTISVCTLPKMRYLNLAWAILLHRIGFENTSLDVKGRSAATRQFAGNTLCRAQRFWRLFIQLATVIGTGSVRTTPGSTFSGVLGEISWKPLAKDRISIPLSSRLNSVVKVGHP